MGRRRGGLATNIAGGLVGGMVGSKVGGAIGGTAGELGQGIGSFFGGLTGGIGGGNAARSTYSSLAQPPASLGGCGNFACFVAGTPVLVPDVGEGDDEMAADTSQGDAPKAAKRNALLAGGMVAVGLSGLFVDERRARRKGRRREDAVDWLFGEDPDGEDGFDEFEPLAEAPGTMQQDRRRSPRIVGRRSPPALLVESPLAALAVEGPGVSALGRQTVATPDATENPPFVVPPLGGSSPGFRLKPVLRTSATSSRVRSKSSDAYLRPRHPARPLVARCLPVVRGPLRGQGALRNLVVFLCPATKRRSDPRPSARKPEHRDDPRRPARSATRNPEFRATANMKVDPATWRFFRLQAEDRWPDGTLDVIQVETLQPPEWIEQHRNRSQCDHVPLPLDLLEMGAARGTPGSVIANELPADPSVPAAVVLTTVNHLNPNVFERGFGGRAGERRDTIRPTGLHKFFSGDRRCWVNTQELKEGERLRRHRRLADGIEPAAMAGRAAGSIT